MRIAAGASLAELGIHQEELRVNGYALQCRITTEDPGNGFRPDTGRITSYRSPGGSGISLDGAIAHACADISDNFDSHLVMIIFIGVQFPVAVWMRVCELTDFLAVI